MKKYIIILIICLILVSTIFVNLLGVKVAKEDARIECVDLISNWKIAELDGRQVLLLQAKNDFQDSVVDELNERRD